jgi:hypothetical protein
MKKLLASSVVILALVLPALAQWHGRLSPNDQRKFDSYYSRWVEYKRTNNRDQIVSMEHRMQDLMAHYRIPANVPYWQIASNGSERDWRGNDHNAYRDHGQNAYPRWRRLPPDEQRKFDSYYSRWLQYRRSGDRDQVVSMEKRMRDVMARNGIPPNVPFDRIASH